MLSSSERDVLFTLNHLSRELQQVMLHAKMKLEDNAPFLEEDNLINSIDYTFETIRRQIEHVDDFLKKDAEKTTASFTAVDLISAREKD